MLSPKELMDAYFDKYVKGKSIYKSMPLQLVDELDTDDNGHVIVIHHPDNGDPLVRPLADWAKEFDTPFDVQ